MVILDALLNCVSNISEYDKRVKRLQEKGLQTDNINFTV